MKPLFLVSWFLLSFWFVDYAQLAIDTNFCGANAQIIKVKRYKIWLEPKLRPGQEYKIWFYFKLKRTRKIDYFELFVRKLPFIPNFIVISTDQKSWKPVFSYSLKRGFYFYRISFPKNSDSLFVALSYPYTITELNRFLAKVLTSPFADTTTLTISEHGRRVPLLIIRDTAKTNAQDLVWILVRQHAFEAPANFCTEGFVDFILSQDSLAVFYRKNVVTYIVPIVDVDNVAEGNSGRMQKPLDFNRDWTDSDSYWLAVKAIKDLMESTAEMNNFRVFIDIHAVFPTGFVDVPIVFNIFRQTEEQFDNLFSFIDIFNGLYRRELLIVTDYTQKPFADLYVKKHYPYVDFVLTFECPWSMPQHVISPEQLRQMGSILAQALAEYLNSNLTR